MSKQFDKLLGLLKELFQLDKPDLDFGIYRIMHAKADEVTKFLDTDLLPQVKGAFAQYRSADKAELQKALDKAIEQATGLGVDPESTAKVKELRQKIASESVDVGALEAEVYDHLYSFFRRYYQEGDFLAKRVYKPGVYSIPYEGEEVKLYWANYDQYYIKTAEYLRDYAFTLNTGDNADPMRVHFRLVDAAEGEHGNVKAIEGKDRVFILTKEDPITGENGELIIRFHYRPATIEDWTDKAREKATAAAAKKPPTQKELITIAVEQVLASTESSTARWIKELAKPNIKTNGEQADYSRLESYLRGYVGRNTFDYFIHKDLSGFLRRELDFYIKNEVMYLDDIESESAPRVEQYLSKIKVIRKIAHKLIDFLAQLEDFQRKLWLKKKFVVEADYCITLDRIPEEFYPEIIASDSQRDEWVELFSINEIKGDNSKPGYSTPLTVEFLIAHQYMTVDTRHYDSNFRERLLATIDSIDGGMDGLVLHGDNFHGLRLLQGRYLKQINALYLDPPYNTDASPIIYKNGFRHSSWCAMFADRMALALPLIANGSLVCTAIDDFEYPNLSLLLEGELGLHHIGTAAVRSKPQGRPTATGFSTNHDYAVFWSNVQAPKLGRLPRSGSKADRYPCSDEKGVFAWANFRKSGTDSDRTDRKRSYYPLFVKEDQVRVPELQWDKDDEEWILLEKPGEEEVVVWPIDTDGSEKVWTCSVERLLRELDDVRVTKGNGGSIEIQKKYRPNQDGALPGTWWDNPEYSASESGTKVLKDLFGSKVFDFPKSIYLVIDNIRVLSSNRSATVLDYFGGSGTTAAAVIAMNREDKGARRFILIEQGQYVDSILVPRIKKLAFSPDWRDGKPISVENGRSLAIKVVRLESYEDTINNLQVRRSAAQKSLLESTSADDDLREQYTLRYMLNVETRESQSLLNISAFADPTAYTLKVKRPGTEETREVAVDLLETFNYLIGLTVGSLAAPMTFSATFTPDTEKRLQLKERLKQTDEGPWWFRTVMGSTPDGRKSLIIWRKLTGDAEQDNLVLDEWFRRQGFSTKDYEFDLIYVNGDNNLENLRQPDETWKVRLIEEDFHRLMFDTSGL